MRAVTGALASVVGMAGPAAVLWSPVALPGDLDRVEVGGTSAWGPATLRITECANHA